MSETKWLYYAFAKDILGGVVFAVIFPSYNNACVGDRVVAEGDDGTTMIGDIIYKDMDRPDDALLNAIFNHILPNMPLKAVSYWSKRDVEWPEEEGAEDGASAEDDSTVSC